MRHAMQILTPRVLMFFLALGPALVLSQSAAPMPEAEVELLRTIDRAVVTGAQEDLAAARDTLQARVQSDGGSTRTSDRYLLAYVIWRLSQHLPENEKKEKKRLLKQAEKELKLVLDANPDDAEAYALRGTVIGDRIGGALSGMLLGPKASKSLERAYELAPENPRVALQRGVGFYFTPKTFGGGIEKAQQELTRAQELYVEEPAEQPWPNWGKVDVFAWLGLILVDSGMIDEAKAMYEEGLRLEPDHAWIRLELLPGLGD